MRLTSCQTQCHWVQLHVKPKQIWVWHVVKPNILRFSNTLKPNRHGSNKLLDLTSLGLVTCWVQVHMDLASCQTQCFWIYLRTESKQTRVYQTMKPIIPRSSYTLSSSRYWSRKLLNSPSIGLVSCQVQVDMGLTTIISPVLGYETLFVYYYDF